MLAFPEAPQRDARDLRMAEQDGYEVAGKIRLGRLVSDVDVKLSGLDVDAEFAEAIEDFLHALGGGQVAVEVGLQPDTVNGRPRLLDGFHRVLQLGHRRIGTVQDAEVIQVKPCLGVDASRQLEPARDRVWPEYPGEILVGT